MAAVHGAGRASQYASHDAHITIWIAVAASVAIHLLLFLAAAGVWDRTRAKQFEPVPLATRLVHNQPAPTPPQVARAVAIPKVEVEPRRDRAPPSRRVAAKPQAVMPGVVAPPAVVPVPSATPARLPRLTEAEQNVPQPLQALADELAPHVSALAPAHAPGLAPAPAPTPAAARKVADPLDPALLGQYRIAIIAAAKRYKRYPHIAVDNIWEGTAEVRLTIDASGAIGSIGLKKRSGYEVLDRQAIDMIRKAKPLTPIPAALQGKAFSIEIPVLFSLKDEAG